jgi:hypothetical protein
VIRSSKKIKAKIIVATGPILPKIEKVDAPSLSIAADTKKEGIKVQKMAMANPNK